jgi:hypothetical protein
MSHSTIWRCRGCKALQGAVQSNGTLELDGQRATLGRNGLARITCPAYGEVRVWKPTTRLGRRMQD